MLCSGSIAWGLRFNFEIEGKLGVFRSVGFNASFFLGGSYEV